MAGNPGALVWQMLDQADVASVAWLQGLVSHPHPLDTAALYANLVPLIKGGPLLLCWWIAFLGSAPGAVRARESLLMAFPTTALALLIGRVLATTLPYRMRPGFRGHPDVHILGGHPEGLSSWSAMPSDHAVALTAFSATLLLADRRLGALALAHTWGIVLLGRVYLGLHGPLDVLVGAAIGLAGGIWGAPMFARHYRSSTLRRFVDAHPTTLLVALILLGGQVANMFEAVRMALMHLPSWVGFITPGG